jgi:hypothetical protein
MHPQSSFQHSVMYSAVQIVCSNAVASHTFILKLCVDDATLVASESLVQNNRAIMAAPLWLLCAYNTIPKTES